MRNVIQRLFLISISPLSCRLITHSECLQELDLDDNLIGDLGGREILEAIMDRKEGQENMSRQPRSQDLSPLPPLVPVRQTDSQGTRLMYVRNWPLPIGAFQDQFYNSSIG